MIANEDSLRNIISQYDIVRISELKYREGALFFTHEITRVEHSHGFSLFILDFNRALLLYQITIQNMQKNDNIKYNLLCENMFLLIIASLEVYLRNTIRRLTWINKIGEVDRDNLKKLLMSLGVGINFNNIYFEELNSIRIYHLLPERLDFQQKDKCRKAFRTFNINLPELIPDIWERIYSSDENSYMQIRHLIIHGGAEFSLSKRKPIDLELIENCIKDISEFVYTIDCEVLSRYPYRRS